MTEDEYITQVKNILDNESDEAESLKKVHELKLPENPNPLLSLVHGDSYELIASRKMFRHEYDDEEFNEMIGDLPTQIIEKIRKYLLDWENGYTYKYSFSLKAKYNLYKDSHSIGGSILNQKYAYKDLPNATTVGEAIKAAKEWNEELPKTQRFDESQKFGHKRQGMATRFDIHAMKKDGTDRLLLSGVLLADFDYLVTSWLIDNL